MNFLAGAFVSVALNFLTTAGLFSVGDMVSQTTTPVSSTATVSSPPNSPATAVLNQQVASATSVQRLQHFVRTPSGIGFGAAVWFFAAISVSVWANFIEKAEKRASSIITETLSYQERDAILLGCLQEAKLPIWCFGAATITLFLIGVSVLIFHI
jgi:hypothetical protein